MADQDAAHADDSATADATFGDRLNRLFENVHPKDRGPYSNAEVARAVDVSETYIGNLRKGKSTNPGYELLQGLAAHFNVPVAYFFDGSDGEKIREDLELLQALKDVGARQVALRTVAVLPEEDVQALMPILEHLKSQQKASRGRMAPRRSGSAGSA
ncbi:helix-turn-helix domain-containing protein (plasmid) [Streptomyces sp. NBC_01278]|uniref:helix-turn-helix domain-containing protein n=1 Tax=Streptomyces sp. NBC_01278 TaxID=2903809 RepID=UPI002E37B674|nr:helix-turn-helix domain-containing protein [Streptomyces sp. NBC_01278]